MTGWDDRVGWGNMVGCLPASYRRPNYPLDWPQTTDGFKLRFTTSCNAYILSLVHTFCGRIMNT